MKDPNIPKKMKKLSIPNFPLLIWLIIGSFLYSRILYALKIYDFYNI